jgi:putative pyruvate formate lyase activating enzyme
MDVRDENQFVTREQNFEPAYLTLYRSGELQRRATQGLAELENCHICPRDCGVNRLKDETAVCNSGRYATVANYIPHLGEEDPLRGWRGSGTIFFSWCNLRCVFCQNFDISQAGVGREVGPEQLAEIMLRLQELQCHNINFVTPEHVVPQIVEALPLAIEHGLRLPLVYNTSAYDSIRSLRLLDGIVDIYMPDFKIWDPSFALRYLKARDYPDVARRALIEMHRQVGVLRMDERGLARRGVLVRHLVMPNDVAGTAAIMRFLAEKLSPDTYVNLMNQYYAAGKVNAGKHAEINRRLTNREYDTAVRVTHDAGLWRLDKRRSL